MNDKNVTPLLPLMLNSTPIGQMSIDLTTGEFSGKISTDMAHLISESIELLEFGFSGRAGNVNPMLTRVRFTEFLKSGKIRAVEQCSLVHEVHMPHLEVSGSSDAVVTTVCPGLSG